MNPTKTLTRDYCSRVESKLWLKFIRENADKLDWYEISKTPNLPDTIWIEFNERIKIAGILKQNIEF